VSAQSKTPSDKSSIREPLVDQAVASRVTVTVDGEKRVIRSNGLPDHLTGRFPNRGNPNQIAAQSYQFSVPAKPIPADKPTPLGMHPFGVAVNGVVFDPGAAEWWNRDPSLGWQYEPMSDAINLGEARQYKGTPDTSFFRRGPGRGGPPPGFRGRRPFPGNRPPPPRPRGVN